MALFVVSYDLRKNKDYKRIIEELERLGGHRALESFWFVDLENTAVQVRDHLKDYVDSDDQFAVVEFTKRPQTWRTRAGTKEWLDAHV